jgi:hypothetical protein
MNRIVLKTLRPGVIPAVLLVWGCASLLSGSDKIDAVIKQASDYLNESIPEGKKIVILNIKSDYPAFSRYIIDTLNADVVNARRLIVVDRSNLSEIQEEIEFQYSGEVSDDSAKALGRKLGADTIVSGAAAAHGAGAGCRERDGAGDEQLEHPQQPVYRSPDRRRCSVRQF